MRSTSSDYATHCALCGRDACLKFDTSVDRIAARRGCTCGRRCAGAAPCAPRTPEVSSSATDHGAQVHVRELPCAEQMCSSTRCTREAFSTHATGVSRRAGVADTSAVACCAQRVMRARVVVVPMSSAAALKSINLARAQGATTTGGGEPSIVGARSVYQRPGTAAACTITQ